MASSLLAFALKRSTAPSVSSTLFTNLLQPKTPLFTATVSSFRTVTSRRSFSSGGTSSSNSSLPPDLPQSAFEPDAWCVLNPLQSAGPSAAVTIKTAKGNKEHKTVRVVMPGVSPDGYKVWLDSKENALCVEGNGEDEMLMVKGETSGRTYAGKIKFKPEEVKVEKIIKSEMKHGILRITVSRNLAA